MLRILADHTAACSVKKQLPFDKIFAWEKRQRSIWPYGELSFASVRRILVKLAPEFSIWG